MKKRVGIMLSMLGLITVLVSGFALLTACGKTTLPISSQSLRQDKEWLKSLNQYLNLAYTEQEDRAAFTSLSMKTLSPALYGTYNIFRMLTFIGENIENPDSVINLIRSLKTQDGIYLDPFQSISMHRPDYETMQAITILTSLKAQPENLDSTVKYLLSLEHNDGTFLTDSTKEITGLDDTRIERIGRGTASVINSLVSLHLIEKIPQETKDAIISEVSSMLGESGPFSSLAYGTVGNLTCAIELLAKINPALIAPRARDYIIYALTNLSSMPVDTYLFPATANRLLDIAQLLGLKEAQQNSVIEGLQSYLKDKIFPLQNNSGGFGFFETVDPLATAENVILAHRLGIIYPNFDKLMSAFDMHWVGNGWAPFITIGINNGSYMSTYYSIELAKFSKWDGYNHKKVENFLNECFSDNEKEGMRPASLEDLYYAVMAIKALNGKLSQEQAKKTELLCLKLADDFRFIKETDVNLQFTYATQISREAGFDLPETVRTETTRLAAYINADLLNGKRNILPETLYDLWQSLPEGNSTLTREEIIKYLESSYDSISGGFKSPRIANMMTTPPDITASSTYIPYPDIVQTYSAMLLLSDIGETLPDKNQTLSFALSCKRKFGFSRWSDGTDINIMATFSAVMILSQSR
jgi:prenyltransferase beta subunit